MDTTQSLKEKKKTKIGRWVFVSFIILVILVSLSNENTSKEITTQSSNKENVKVENREDHKKEEIINISATDLYDQYTKNEIAADDKYKNKILQVNGVINVLGKDFLDNPYITLKTKDIVGEVQCLLSSSEKDKAINLQKNKTITLVGKNTGKLGNVILNDCRINQ